MVGKMVSLEVASLVEKMGYLKAVLMVGMMVVLMASKSVVMKAGW